MFTQVYCQLSPRPGERPWSRDPYWFYRGGPQPTARSETLEETALLVTHWRTSALGRVRDPGVEIPTGFTVEDLSPRPGQRPWSRQPYWLHTWRTSALGRVRDPGVEIPTGFTVEDLSPRQGERPWSRDPYWLHTGGGRHPWHPLPPARSEPSQWGSHINLHPISSTSHSPNQSGRKRLFPHAFLSFFTGSILRLPRCGLSILIGCLRLDLAAVSRQHWLLIDYNPSHLLVLIHT